MVAHLSGAVGVDFGGHPLDTPLGDIETDGVRSIVPGCRNRCRAGKATVRDLGLLQGRNSRVVGTPETIADQLQQWRDAGVDGINVVNATIPGSYDGVRRSCDPRPAGPGTGSARVCARHHTGEALRHRPTRRASPRRTLPGFLHSSPRVGGQVCTPQPKTRDVSSTRPRETTATTTSPMTATTSGRHPVRASSRKLVFSPTLRT